MSCPACGHENRDGARFCDECGGPLQHACASCGTDLRPAAKFCDDCGTPVAASIPAREPLSYTPNHLVEKILSQRSAIEGERKQVTVLFADVKGSMELSEQIDPEAWHGILDRFFHILTEGVHRFEGTVNQYTGDGIMALFGAPITHEDHAQRACYTALHLMEAMRGHAREVRREHGLDFGFRMGLHSGDVVVGKIGDDLRMDYTAQGHTVGLAQRMESLAEADACFLSDDTARLVSGYFELESLGEFRIKGVREPVAAHRLAGVGAARTRFDVSRARGLTRFVGRGADVHLLETSLERARAGQGPVVGVVADAGTGKSRLCFEFVEACRAKGLNVLEGHAVAHGKNLPLVPILEIFRGYYGITDEDDDRTAREKIAGRLLLLDDGFREVLPVLFELLGVSDPVAPAPTLEPEARQRQLLGVLRRLLQRAQPETPGVILVEDLHWLDSASEAWIEEWTNAIAGTHNLLLVNFRPEYRAPWLQRSHYQQLALAPLGPDAIRELLDDLLGTDPSTKGLAETIHQRTEGNPFFAEEIVRSLIESGQLAGTPGRYELRAPVESLVVPDSVSALLGARIDRLAEREKRVLQTAAVIGKQFREPLLEEVTDLGTGELADSLSRLRDAEFIDQQSLYPVAEYVFRHPLTQEVALGSQLADRRRVVHAAVARATLELDADKLDERAASVAYHWEHAGELLDAARWTARATRRFGKGEPAAAVEGWRHLRELLHTLPEDSEVMQLGVEACVELLDAALWVGLPKEEVSAVFEHGLRLARASGAVRGEVLLISRHGLLLVLRGDGDPIARLQAQEDAMRLAEELGDPVVDVEVSGRLAGALLVHGSAERALKIADTALQRVEARGTPPRSFYYVRLLGARAQALGALGDLTAEAEKHEEVLQHCRETGNLNWAAVTHGSLTRNLSRRGDLEGSLRHARRGAEIAERLDLPLSLSLAYMSLARVVLERGEFEEARELLERCDRIGEESATGRANEARREALLGEALLGCGAPEQALESARRAVADGRGVLGTEARLSLARVLRATQGADATPEIERLLDEATARIEADGHCIYAPEICEERAALSRMRGDADACRAELARASSLWRSMGADARADRLLAEASD